MTTIWAENCNPTTYPKEQVDISINQLKELYPWLVNQQATGLTRATVKEPQAGCKTGTDR
jgi:hypothetical protein